jgi:hypothetical protein
MCTERTAWDEWLLAEVWKSRGIIKQLNKVRWPLYLGKQDAEHIFLNCSETTKWRVEIFQ